MKREIGYFLLEILAALLISGIVGGAFSSILHHFVFLRGKAVIERREKLLYLRTTGLINEVLENLDSHRFNLPPRVHQKGLITYVNGEPNPISLRSDSRAPNRDCDALSTFKLSMNEALKVQNATSLSVPLLFGACPIFPGTLTKSYGSYRDFLGLSLNGFLELTGSVTLSAAKSSGCLKLSLSPANGMIAPVAWDNDPRLVRLIIPIKANYTIYTDRAGQLRYLSHRGAENIENQPIINGISAFKLTLTKLDLNLYSLGIKAGFLTSKLYTFSTLNALARKDYYNLLFNL